MLQILTCRMDLATRYGTDAAVFLHNIVYWTLKNKAEDRHFYEGRWWMNASLRGLAALYPLWSAPQIKRMIAKLRDNGALLVGDFNEDRMVRTNWYSPSDEILALYEAGIGGPAMGRNRKMQETESSGGGTKSENANKDKEESKEEIPPISPKGGTACAERKRDKSVPKWKPERFEAFWTWYRTHARGEDRQGAVNAWDKLRPDDELIAAMGKALQAQVRSEEWRRGVGIPYAKTWLNNARWKDAPKAPPPEETEDGGPLREPGVRYI
ncbi:MAG: hypothetical protein NC489_28040 [Ruminococcus flavefaciens]|nr:hypothetical protein [Ruminococcus flavefaciens]